MFSQNGFLSMRSCLYRCEVDWTAVLLDTLTNLFCLTNFFIPLAYFSDRYVIAGLTEMRFDVNGNGNHRLRTRIIGKIREDGNTRVKLMTAPVELPARSLRPQAPTQLLPQAIFATRWTWFHSTDNLGRWVECSVSIKHYFNSNSRIA